MINYKEVLKDIVEDFNSFSDMLDTSNSIKSIIILKFDENNKYRSVDPVTWETLKFTTVSLTLIKKGIRFFYETRSVLTNNIKENTIEQLYQDLARNCLRTLLLSETVFEQDVKSGKIKLPW